MTKDELDVLIADKIKEVQGDREELSADIKEAISTAVKSGIDQDRKDNKAAYEPPPEEKLDPTGGFSCMADFAKHVSIADSNGGIDKRLKDFDVRGHKAAGDPTLEEGDPAAGGYLIPTEFRNQILERAEEKNPILDKVMEIPMQTSSVDIPYLSGFNESSGEVYGGIEWKWTAEKSQRSATAPELGEISLKLKNLAGMCYVTNQLLEDSPISMDSLLTSGFADGLNFILNKVFIGGSGAGQPQGFINSNCAISIDKQGGQKAATINFENIVNMIARAYGEEDFIWMVNKQCLPQLCTMSLVIGTGGVPVFMPANGAAGKPFPTLFGYPIVWSKHCKALGTEGDIVLADWSQYLVGKKAGASGGTKAATSIHLKFDYDQTAFKFGFRIDGQSWWPEAYVGPESPDSLSPCVMIERLS